MYRRKTRKKIGERIQDVDISKDVRVVVLQNVAGSVFYNYTVLRWTRLSISPIAVVLYHVEQGYSAA